MALKRSIVIMLVILGVFQFSRVAMAQHIEEQTTPVNNLLMLYEEEQNTTASSVKKTELALASEEPANFAVYSNEVPEETAESTIATEGEEIPEETKPEIVPSGLIERLVPKKEESHEMSEEELIAAELAVKEAAQKGEESKKAENIIDDPSDPYGVELEDYVWEGNVLNKHNGTVRGPSGKETYYNLDMTGVVWIMEDLGYTYEYHVREDGVKMYGPYIMCAANLEIRPRGTILKTSLGWAMVCDTGGYAKVDPTWLDIAVTW